MKKAQGSLSNIPIASALGLLLLTGLLSGQAMADRDDQQRPDRQMQSGQNQGVTSGPGGQVQRGPRRDAAPRTGGQFQHGPSHNAVPRSGGYAQQGQSRSGSGSQHFERVEQGRDHYRSPSWQLDMRFHRDRYYPRHGSVVNALPPGYRDFRFRGNHYYFQGGVWFRSYGPNFVITAPPFGLVIPFLPYDYTTLWLGSVPYYYANDVYYTPYPSGGYVVVDPPVNIDSAVIGPPATEAPPTAAIYPPPGTAPPTAAIYPPPPPPPPSPDQSSETAIKVVPSPPEPAVNTNAEPMFVYPAKGQSASRMNKDRKACEKQATEQTDYDPAGNAVDMRQRNEYQSAVKTCLEGRGYTLK